jgi:hypothetical protein
MGEEDHSSPTPLGEQSADLRIGAPRDVHTLPEVARGRMLCIVHGRMCYRRISRVGVGEWICPDERHRTPISAS